MPICIWIVYSYSGAAMAVAELSKHNSCIYPTKAKKTYALVLYKKFVDSGLDASLYVFPLSSCCDRICHSIVHLVIYLSSFLIPVIRLWPMLTQCLAHNWCLICVY